MFKQVKEAWIANLRSGLFTQIRGKLFDASTGGVCCLGALCLTLAHQKGSYGPKEAIEEFGYRNISLKVDTLRLCGLSAAEVGRIHDSIYVMSDVVNARCPKSLPGLENLHPQLVSLSRLNDGVKLTFEEIADIVDAGLITI